MEKHEKPKGAPRSGAAALEKGLDLFLRIARDEGRTPLSALAADMGLASSTARRLVTAFERRGLLMKAERGRYAAGVALADITAAPDPRAILAELSRPVLRRLARASGRTLHLGVFEGDMVTYVVKEQGGVTPLFTRDQMQLEAYCSAIGKVLLAFMPAAAREAYLAAGPFVALTQNTITDSAKLRLALRNVQADGYAIDDAEIADGLRCVAVPVRGKSGSVIAAISCSQMKNALTPADIRALLRKLQRCASGIEGRLRMAGQAA